LDHVSKFVHRPESIFARTVRLMRREERNRRVTPVVDLARRTIQGVELEHWEKFDSGDAKLLEIRNLLNQTSIGAARLLTDSSVRVGGDPANVHFVDDGPGGRQSWRGVALPIIRARIDNNALHRRRGIVAFSPRRFTAVGLRNGHAPAVW